MLGLRLRALTEGFRNSLFFVPALWVLGAVLLSRVMSVIDDQVDTESVPRFLRYSVSSAQPLLGAIAGATITVSGIVFSVTAVAVQLASSQFSPRVLRGFLRDRFQQTVMGVMVGTFVYALLTLSEVRDLGALEEIPQLSVSMAVVLAVVSVLAILASIDHTTRTMRVGEIVQRITDETVEAIADRFPEAGKGWEEPARPPVPPTPGHVVGAPETGWIQQVSSAILLAGLPEGAIARLEVRVGSFVGRDAPFATIWAVGASPDELDRAVHRAVTIGTMRTMQEDVPFGIRQLVDIALRALSPAINDPTTAFEVVVHLGVILRSILLRELPPITRRADGDRWLLREEEVGYDDYVVRAFSQIRAAARDHPAVLRAVLRQLAMLRDELARAGRPPCAALEVEAALVLEEAAAGQSLPADLERLREAAAEVGWADVSPCA